MKYLVLTKMVMLVQTQNLQLSKQKTQKKK